MANGQLKPDWPTRQVQLVVAGVNLQLQVPDNPYAMLDLPAVEQAFHEDEYMPYWAHLWPASLMLGDWLVNALRQARAGQGGPAVPSPPAPVIEIGCGLGVPGLLAARLGYRVTLTDYDGDALDYVRRNARVNRVKVRTDVLDWRHPPVDRFPLILAADVLYEQRNHTPILELLRLSLHADGLAALSDPCRQVCDAFAREARDGGWKFETVPARWQGTPGRIFLLRR